MPELKKANKGGRPSYHSLALKEAEKKGEEIMQLTKDELETLVASQVQVALNEGGRVKRLSLAHTSRSNRKRLGAVSTRKEHNVATKLAIAKDVQAMMKTSCAVKEVSSHEVWLRMEAAEDMC